MQMLDKALTFGLPMLKEMSLAYLTTVQQMQKDWLDHRSKVLEIGGEKAVELLLENEQLVGLKAVEVLGQLGHQSMQIMMSAVSHDIEMSTRRNDADKERLKIEQEHARAELDAIRARTEVERAHKEEILARAQSYKDEKF
jgi:hypothetical protein